MSKNHNCEVCGARRPGYSTWLTVCSSICHRAKANGRTRGDQMRAEVAALLRRPWSDEQPVSPFRYVTGNNYNSPQE
jgi:hypothetical protein